MQKKRGRIQCYEADLVYPSLPCVPKAEQVHVLNCEKNFIVDGKCSKGSLGKKCKSPKGFKNKYVIMMNRSHTVKPVLASGLGHDEHHSTPGNASAEVQVMHRYLGQMKGYICMVAKHQLGCRFLQRIFDEGSSEDAQAIFREVIDHVELIMDPFGKSKRRNSVYDNNKENQ